MTDRASIPLHELRQGLRVEWVQPQFDVRAATLTMPVTVVGVVRRRVHIRLDNGRRHIVKASTLHRKNAP